MKKPLTVAMREEIVSAFNQSLPETAPSIEPGTETEEVTAPLWGKSWDELEYEYFDFENLLFAFIPDPFVPYFLGFALSSSLDKNFSGPESLNVFFDRWTDLGPEFSGLSDQAPLHEISQRLRTTFSLHQKAALRKYVEFRAAHVSTGNNEGAERFVQLVCE